MRILYIEDDPAHIELTRRSLENSGAEFNLQTAPTIADTFSLLKDNEYDVILSDYRLPDGSGLDVIRIAHEQNLSTAIVLITNQEDINTAVAALKAGAVDYIVKQSDYLHKLPIVLSNAYKHTQIEKQKKALYEIENKYRNIFENAVEGIFQSSPDGRYLSLNPAMAQIYGYKSPEEMIEKISSISTQIHQLTDGRDRFTEKIIENGVVENFEAGNLKKDGSLIWTSTNARVVKDKNGKILYYEGSVTDITKQKKAENAILEAEERYRMLVEKLPAVIFMDKFNDNQSTQYISPRIKELLGYTPEEWVTGNNLWENSLHQDDKDRVIAEDVRTNETGEPFRIEYRLRHRDGHYVWVKEDASVIMGEDGTPLFWQGILLDITEQKYAEEAIKANEGSYRELFNSVTQAIYIQDREGHFLDVNDGASIMYGYPREFFIGKSPEVLSAPNKNDLNSLVKMTERAFAGEPQEFEFWGLRSNGQIFPKIVTLNKGTYFGQDVIIAIAQDITARKQAEKLLERQLKALAVLHAASMAGTQSNAEDEIIEQVTRITASLYSDVCGILLLNDQGNVLTPHPSYMGANIIDWKNGYPITEGITGRAVRTGGSIRINDITKDPNYIEIASGIKSELCVPFLVQNRIIGVFDVESSQVNAFDEEDERLLNTIASGLGTAIEKLRLFEAEQAQRQRETAMLELIRAAASSLDLKQVLQSILDQLVKIIPSDSGTIQLLAGDHLNVLAAIGKEALNFAKRESITLNKFPLNNFVITEKQPVRVDVTYLDDRYQYIDETADVKSFLGIPLIAKGETIGMITLDSYQTYHFTEEDEELGLTVANYASVAIENARLFDTEQRRRKQAEFLHKATEALTTSIELDKLFEIIFNSLAELVPYDSASIEMADKEGYFEIVAGRNISNELIGKKYTTNPEKWGGVEKLHQPLIIPNIQADDRFEKFEGSEYIKSWMGIPLFSQGKPIGFLNLDSKITGFFNKEHIAVTRTFANQAGIVIENARLFQEISRRSQIIEALADIANEIAATQEVIPALNKIAKRTLSLLNASSVAVYLLQDDKQTIRIVSAQGAYKKELKSHTIKLGEGITGNVIANGKPEIVDEMAKDSRKITVPGTPETDKNFETMMSAPLILHGEAIGAINAWRSKSIGLFDKSELNFLVSIAHQASISIESGNLFQESIRRAQEAAAIAEVGRDISATLQLDIVLERIAMYAKILLKAETSAVYLSEPDKLLLNAVAAIGADSEEIKNDPIETGIGILGNIALRKSGEIVNNTINDPRTVIVKGTQVEINEHIMGASVLNKDNLTGLLVVWRNGVDKEFKVTELGFLSSLAQQVAVAIENARLFEAERKRRQEAENLRLAATAITSSLDPKTVLETILTALQQVVPFDSGTMMLLENEYVRIVAAQGFGNNDSILNRTFPADNKLFLVANQLKKPFILEDAIADERFEKWATEYPIRAWMGIPLIAHGKIIGYITLDSLKVGAFDQNAAALAQTFALHAAAAIDNTQLFENLQHSNQELSLAYDTTLAGWAKALELRDKETHGHTNRVTDLTMELARFIGISKADLVHLRRGVLLHDIGKMGVPDEILHKEGPLTDKEWIEMRKHPQYAFDLLYPISFLRPALDIPYSHHEWWDGNGYPQKLKGEEIPLAARLFAVVDVWDALLSDRPYRKAWKKAKTVKYLREQAGAHFDPNIVETFLNMMDSRVEQSAKKVKKKAQSEKSAKTSKQKTSRRQ